MRFKIKTAFVDVGMVGFEEGQEVELEGTELERLTPFLKLYAEPVERKAPKPQVK